jgi:hypothetical protein
MATSLRLSMALRNAGLDAIFTSAQNSGKLRIYDGSQPATPDTAVSGQTLLAELTLNATAWAAASSGSKAAGAITGAVAVATGTGTWFRITNSAGSTAYVDGSVGATGSTSNLELPTATITAGVTVNVTSLSMTIPSSY